MVHGVETGLSGQETADVDESLGVEITAAPQINTDVGDALGASAGCGTPEEEKELENSYKHLCELRDEVIAMGIIPPVAEWHKLNSHID